MKNLGLVTYRKLPHLCKSDQLLVEPFRQEGFHAVAVSWDDPSVDWSTFDYLVLRSCWNYYRQYEKFLNWLSLIEQLHIQLWNPLPIIKWNINKKYLKELEYKSIPTVPTIHIEKGTKYLLADIAKRKQWTNLVVKPAINAEGTNIVLIKQNEYSIKQRQFETLCQQSDILIQPLMQKMLTEGEYSLVFLGNQFSHAVLKTPQRGDFRFNLRRGAIKKIELSKKFTQQAAYILTTIQSPLLYARVDGINQNGKLILMELELIEPYLFLDQDRKSPERFIQAFKKLIE